MSADIRDVLSVERVKAAYKATGLKPVRSQTILRDGGGKPVCGCAVGAVLVADGVAECAKYDSSFAAWHLNVNAADLATFMRGFDCVMPGVFGERPGMPAWEHGRAVARVVFGDGEGP